jgi:hypothetical protein
MPKINVLLIKFQIKILISLRSMIFGKKNSNHPPISQVRSLDNNSLGSPGKTLMLLKKASKPQRSGFKRKKVYVLGSFKEIQDGTKKVKESTSAFATIPGFSRS